MFCFLGGLLLLHLARGSDRRARLHRDGFCVGWPKAEHELVCWMIQTLLHRAPFDGCDTLGCRATSTRLEIQLLLPSY
uniref:Putative secreted peptide n=1 Tax=Anopheles braziliensis TaxID=58242 RepID=A0A2M3ZS06_9DIPT